MTTLASTALTLTEWATRLDPGGKPAAVIELLGQTNEMLTDMLWMQCNDGAGALIAATDAVTANAAGANVSLAGKGGCTGGTLQVNADGSLTFTPPLVAVPSTGPDRCCTTCVSSWASMCLPESDEGSNLSRWNTMFEPTV